MKSLLLSLAAVGLLAGPALAQDACAPAKVTTLTATTLYGAIMLTWTATGDDCTTGNAATYEVRWSTSPITEENWWDAQVLDSGNSATNGNQNGACKDVFPCATTAHYFGVILFDEAGNRSPLATVGGAARCVPPYETCN
jgi:hypothetical protein